MSSCTWPLLSWTASMSNNSPVPSVVKQATNTSLSGSRVFNTVTSSWMVIIISCIRDGFRLLRLIDLELGVAIEAEDLFELKHLIRPIIFEQNHLDVTGRFHRRQGSAQFMDRHCGVLIRHALPYTTITTAAVPDPVQGPALGASRGPAGPRP